MEVVLITGQLGTGKSTVASMLQSKGAAVVSFGFYLFYFENIFILIPKSLMFVFFIFLDELREKSCKPGSSTFKKA